MEPSGEWPSDTQTQAGLTFHGGDVGGPLRGPPSPEGLGTGQREDGDLGLGAAAQGSDTI